MMVDFGFQRRNIEKLLKRRAFSGHYVERRLLDEQRGYRDVVWLSPEETELAADLSFANETYKSLNIFIPYSTQPVPCLWVTLVDVPLGCHWFQITSTILTENELIINLKSLRSFPGIKYEKPKPVSAESVRSSFEDILQTLKTDFVGFIKTIDVISVIKFLLIACTALLTGLVHFTYYLGDFTIKLMREISIFFQTNTPLLVACFDFISKIIGGFYILLAMLFRGNTTRRPQPQHSPMSIGFRDDSGFSKNRQSYF